MAEDVHERGLAQGRAQEELTQSAPQGLHSTEREALVSALTPLGGAWGKERLIWLVWIVAIYALYVPFTRWAIKLSPLDMSVALDRALPLSRPWIVIYAMIYPAAVTPLFVVKDALLFRRVALAFLWSAPIGLGCFLLLPVHMHLRPALNTLIGADFYTWGVQLCYAVDVPSGCFPSLHVTYATLAAITCSRANRRAGLVMWVVAIAINLSTMLVKQHFFADVVAGVALAYGSDWLSHHTPWRFFQRPDEAVVVAAQRVGGELTQEEALRPLLAPTLIFLAFISALYVLYLSGLEAKSVVLF
jgi:membrane-associated phospholipid phosphatase